MPIFNESSTSTRRYQPTNQPVDDSLSAINLANRNLPVVAMKILKSTTTVFPFYIHAMFARVYLRPVLSQSRLCTYDERHILYEIFYYGIKPGRLPLRKYLTFESASFTIGQ